jgi:hypothetical protein
MPNLAAVDRLAPGDLLLYSRASAINLAIRVKTWSRYTHAEVFLGPDVAREICRRAGRLWKVETVFASRNPSWVVPWIRAPYLVPIGGGVDLYNLDIHGLTLIRRPHTFDVELAIAWLSEPGILGQSYDVVGLFAFYKAAEQGRDNGAMFCSEAAGRLWKKAGALKGENTDADQTSPGMLAWTDAAWNLARLDGKGRSVPLEQT